MLTPLVRRTYAPRGKTPIQKCWSRHDRISAISAITISPRRNRLGLYFKLLDDNRNAKAKDIVDFLRLLDRHIQRPLSVIWDRINIHDAAKLVKEFLLRHKRIKTYKLPAYAPDLNPDEGVWNHTKYARLANFAPADKDDLRNTIDSELDKLRSRKDLITSFIRHTKLPMGFGGIY
jgi:transposase